MSLSNEYFAGFAPSEQEHLQATIATLRKMRGAGGMLQNSTNHENQINQVIEDAEILAQNTVPYLVSFLASLHTAEQLASWLSALTYAQQTYRSFPMVKHVSGNTLEHAADMTILRLQCLWTNGPKLIKEHFIEENQIPKLELTDFFTDEIGITSPLSTDFLVASCFAEYIKQFHSSTYPTVKPVILTAPSIPGYLPEAIGLPKDKNGEPYFKYHPKIAILLDRHAFGYTISAMKKGLNTEYPGKVLNT